MVSHRSVSIERRPGTYALVLRCTRSVVVRVGRLGSMRTRPGFYVYVGSAFGPGGVRARVERHARRSGRPHWHVDHLRPVTRLREVWHSHDPLRREHDWARGVGSMQCAETELRGFGSSDCACPAHLFFFRERPSVHRFRRIVRGALPEHAPIRGSALEGPGSGDFPRLTE
jgi:Uri superfamily endonuclease